MSKLEEGQLDGVVYKGVLEKVARLGFNSKKLCVLSEKHFSYFPDQKAQGTLKQILLKDVQAVKRNHSCKGFQFEIITEQRTEHFATASLEQLEYWIRILQSAVINTRRNSIGLSSLSGFRKSDNHKYEDVDIEKGKQPRVSSVGSSSKTNVVRINGYEEVDINVDTPNLASDQPRSNSKAPIYSLAKPVESVGSSSKTNVVRINGYEEVDINVDTPNLASDQPRSNSKAPIYSLAKPVESPVKKPKSHPAVVNSYETVDLDEDSSPKLVTEATGSPPSDPPKATKETDTLEPPVYATAKHVTRSNNSENEKKVHDPMKLPTKREVCSTVDCLGGPPSDRPLQRPQSDATRIPPSGSPDPHNYSSFSENLPSQVQKIKSLEEETSDTHKDDPYLYSQVNKLKNYEKETKSEAATYSSVADVSPVETPNQREATVSSRQTEIYADGKSSKLNEYENMIDEDIYDEGQSSNSINNPPLPQNRPETNPTEAGNTLNVKVPDDQTTAATLTVLKAAPSKQSNNNNTEAEAANRNKEPELSGKNISNEKLPASLNTGNKKQDSKTTAATPAVLQHTSPDQTYDSLEFNAAKRNHGTNLSYNAIPDINDLVASIHLSNPVPSLKYGPQNKDTAIIDLQKYLSSQQINTFQFSFLTRESSNMAISKLKAYLNQM